MAYNNEGLIVLKQQSDRKEFLTEELRKLNKSRYEVRSGVLKLEHIMEKEQADVDKLQKPGITSFIYNLTGKYEKKFNKEYMEAREASSNYTKAAQELAIIDDELQRAEHEFRELGDCEKKYKLAFEEKVKLIMEANIPESEAVISLDRNVKSLRKEIKDMDDMLLSGRDVVSSAKYIIMLEEEIEEYRRRSSYDDPGSEERERQYQRRQILNEQSVNIGKRLTLFRDNLIGISAFAKEYDDISYLSRFLDDTFREMSSEYGLNPHRIVSQVETVSDRLNSVYESIEKKYAEVYGEFENLVLQIIL